MLATENGYDVKTGYLSNAIKNIVNFHHYNLPKFEIKEYATLIDSSNIKPKNWFTLAIDIIKNYDNYDGFVILHGTDTLSYTSSVLSFMLENLQKPVIITGSQIPISEVRTDGVMNILDSLIIACSDDIKEVCVYFNQKLLRGNRTTKISSSHLNAFNSPNYEALATSGIDINIHKERLLKRENCNNKPNIELLGLPKIAILNIFPGMDEDLLEKVLEPPLQGLILKTYGAGNMIDSPNIHRILKKANQRGVIIVNCTQCIYGSVKMSAYKTSNGLVKAGVISGNDMTDEAAFGKLFYLLSKKNYSQDKVKQLFVQNLQGELSN